MTLADKIHHCVKCKHEWLPRKLPVLQCPKCKTLYWNKPRKERKS